MNRFGCVDTKEIDNFIDNSIPKNTVRSKNSVWRQFMKFCEQRKYDLTNDRTVAELCNILKDWAWNMKKENGDDYKEYSLKCMWNSTAKTLQEMYLKEFNVKIDPFQGIEFKSARDSRNAKRRELQKLPEKRKQSSAALSLKHVYNIIDKYDEETPDGLQKKFYYLASVELAWRGGEGVTCLTKHFKFEISEDGNETGRLEYNPIFTKTCQGGSQKCADSKWLIQNTQNPQHCPVRLFKKLIGKRGPQVTCSRLFLTPNPFWKRENSYWYKNSPIGKNEFSKWTKLGAESIGLDTKRLKITNHSCRSTAVSQLAKSGVPEQQLIKITGHSSSSSIQPYLQMDEQHHQNIINELRGSEENQASTALNTAFLVEEENQVSTATVNTATSSRTGRMSQIMQTGNVTYNNCTFNFN